MRFWCISLRERLDRRSRAERHFRDHRIPVTILDAWNGHASGVATRFPFERCWYHVSPGCVGNAISWYGALQAIQGSDDEVHIVFEDDVHLAENFANKLEKLIEAAPDDWDVIYLGHCCTDGKQATAASPGLAEIRYPQCTHALAIRRRAAPVLQRAAMLAWGPIDIQFELLALPQLRVYCATPPLVSQCDSPSSIHRPVGGWEAIPGWFDFQDVYDEFAVAPDGSIIVEVGSWLGRSTAYLATRLKERGACVEFYAVDTWRGSQSEQGQLDHVEDAGGSLFWHWHGNMLGCHVRGYVSPMVCDSVSGADRFADASVWRVFIDGDHAHEAVLRDVRAWLPKLAPGGVIAGHDYDRESVKGAVAEALGDRKVEQRPPRSWWCQP